MCEVVQLEIGRGLGKLAAYGRSQRIALGITSCVTDRCRLEFRLGKGWRKVS